jgi:hypothetical protein
MEPTPPTGKSKKIYAQRVIKHPCRVLYTGRSGMGKTWHAIQFFLDAFSDQIKRLIVICPSFYTQDCFRVLDPFVRGGLDVITNPNKFTFANLKKDIIAVNERRAAKGKKAVPTLIFIDDLAGDNIIHGSRQGAFPNLAIQFRPLGISCILITQQATSVSPAYRDNVNAVIAFPSQREGEKKWLVSEYNMGLRKGEMEAMIDTAWKGYGVHDDSEWGTHFLFINAPARKPLEYYADFRYRLTPPTSTPKRKREDDDDSHDDGPTRKKKLSHY